MNILNRKLSFKFLIPLFLLTIIVSSSTLYIYVSNAVVPTVTIGAATGQIPATFIVYNVGSFYYVRDGRTGSIVHSSSDASTEIQYALNNLTPGRTTQELVVLRGEFVLTKQGGGVAYAIDVPSYTKLEIQGKLKFANSFSIQSAFLLRVYYKTMVEIYGGEIDGNGLNQAVNGIYLSGIYVQNSSLISIHDIHSYAIGYTHVVGWTINLGYGTTNFSISHITAELNGADGLAINGASYGSITDCVFSHNSKTDLGGAGIWINSDHITVSNIIGHDNRWGTVRVEAFETSRVDVTLNNIQSYGDQVVGISIDKHATGSWTLSKVSLSNFIIEDCAGYAGLDILAQSQGQVFDITVSNGKIYNTVAGYGVEILNANDVSLNQVNCAYNYYDGVSTIDSQRIFITNSIMTNNARSNMFTSSGITLYNTTYSIVSNVEAFDWGYPMYQAWGLRESGPSNYNLISNCIFSTNVAGGALILGAQSKAFNFYNETSWIT